MLKQLLLRSVITAMATALPPALAGADSTGGPGGTPATAGSDKRNRDATLLEALRGGSTAVRFRYRYEFVADEAFTLDAHASTLRTTLRYDTLEYHGFGAGVEVENVRPIGGELYDNLGAGHRHNGRFGRPVVADPGLTEINQAVLRFTARPGTVATFGRQEILFDDQRFVGPVGWRQNQQSFDAARLDTDLLPKGRLTYTLLHNVHRVTGAVDPLTGHLLHAAFGRRGTGAVILYTHALDYERQRHRSATTFGVEITGTRPLSVNTALSYEVEAARQLGTFGNPTTLDAGYLHLAGGGRYRGITVRAGWERLGGSPAPGGSSTRRSPRCTRSTAGRTSSWSRRSTGSTTCTYGRSAMPGASVGRFLTTTSAPWLGTRGTGASSTWRSPIGRRGTSRLPSPPRAMTPTGIRPTRPRSCYGPRSASDGFLRRQ